jgi:hypothetical protein
LTSDASLSLGPIQWSGSGGPHYLESECYGCRILVVSGVAMPLELKMDVYAGTGFALLPPGTPNAASFAEASLEDFWVFDQSGQRVPGHAVSFTETRVDRAQLVVSAPEPGGVKLVVAGLRLVRHGGALKVSLLDSAGRRE